MSADRLPPDPHRTAIDAGQLTLDDVLESLDRLADLGDRAATIRARFLRFHRDNPGVYDELVSLAREARRAGLERVGFRRLWEVLRWRQDLRVARDPAVEPYKLNDHYCPHYSRLIMDREPDLADLFETRELRAP